MKTLEAYLNTPRWNQACRACGVDPRIKTSGEYWNRARHLIPLIQGKRGRPRKDTTQRTIRLPESCWQIVEACGTPSEVIRAALRKAKIIP